MIPTIHQKKAGQLYRHLFFDLDHTLWDFETNSQATLLKLFHEYGLHQMLTPDFEGFYERYSYHNKRLWDKYHHGLIKQEDLRWKRMWLAMLDFKKPDEKLARELSLEYLKILPTQRVLFPYALEIIQHLTHKGYELHLITNGFEEVQKGKLLNSGLDTFFKEVITSEKAMSLKPHKAIFDYALEAAGASKKESIMLGDNLDADIRGAMEAGLDTVFVNHLREETTLKPTYTVYNLQELETIF